MPDARYQGAAGDKNMHQTRICKEKKKRMVLAPWVSNGSREDRADCGRTRPNRPNTQKPAGASPPLSAENQNKIISEGTTKR